MGTLIRDLQYSLRMLRKNFAMSAVIVLSIGLGIGVNTTIFTLLNVVLLRPLPGTQSPQQLTELYTSYEGGMRYGAVSYPDYKDWRDRNTAFAGLLAQSLVPVNLSRGDHNEIVSGAIVSGNYFSVLGVEAAQGRTFAAEENDDSPNAHPVAVISYGLWQKLYGGNPAVVGKIITLNAQNFTIVGVAARDFAGANIGLSVDVWAPMSMQPVLAPAPDRLKSRSMHWLDVMGRLKPGVTAAQARTMLKPVSAQLAQEFPDTNGGIGITIITVGEGPSDVQSFLLPVVELLMALVFLIFLIACFNVANLLLSRGNSREGEVAIRLALGATRKSLVRLLLTESVMLAIISGGVALLLAYGSIAMLARFKPPTSVPISLGLALDGRVILFTLLMSLAAGVIFGVLPAFRATKTNLLSTLRNEGFFKVYRKSKLQNALVVVQIAMSLFLLVSAGLILRSLQFAKMADTGFKADNMVLANMDVGLAGYDPGRGIHFYKQVLQRVQALPGVRSASLAEAVPMELETSQQLGAFVEGYDSPNHKAPILDYNIVSPGYFNTMEIPLTQGRDFTEQDMADAPGVVIVNEAFAKRYWPGADPIGKKISIRSPQGPYWQVVGVAKNSKYYNITEKPMSFLYLPFYQRYQSGMVLHLSTTADPASYVSIAQREVEALDHSVPVYRVRTMKEHLAVSLLELRGAMLFLGIFGLLALVLASIGLYGLMAYSIEKRRSEIAIRMAVGAQSSHVLKLIIKEGMTLTVVGLVFGLVLVFACGRALSSFLYGISPADPLTMVVTSLFLIGIAFVASFVPAWRAMRTDAMQALRS